MSFKYAFQSQKICTLSNIKASLVETCTERQPMADAFEWLNGVANAQGRLSASAG